MSFEPVLPYPKEKCGICLEKLKENVWAHGTHHLYHGRCLALWVKVKPSCPSCCDTIDATSLLANNVLLDEDSDQEDAIDDFPKQMIHTYLGVMLFAASLPVYDVIANGNPIVIGAIASLGVGILIRKLT